MRAGCSPAHLHHMSVREGLCSSAAGVALAAGERGASGGRAPAAEEERQALHVSRMRTGTLGGLG